MRISQLLFRSLGRRLPVTSGELEHQDLRSPVTIRRDSYGVPYIDAGNDWDAWFALGFCHGQDRSFQLEGILRTVRGTLSEIAGIEGLSVDRLSRRVGFKRSAEAHLEAIDDDIREMLDAHAAGVNAGRQQGLTRQAHEFTLLRSHPTEWEPSDSLGLLKLMSMMMSTNWAEELARYQILIRDGIEALDVLEPGSNPELPVTNPPGELALEPEIEFLDEARQILKQLGLQAGGSNNWAISGSRTKSGNPILSNDPHLLSVLPNQFYLAHIKTPDWGAVGGTFVGTPGFFLGHNGHAAWGITIGFLDNTDLFLEDIGDDGASVREGDDWVRCEVRDEHIKVSGADDLTERVLVTPRGPIIGPALDGRPVALSLSAVWLQPHQFRSVFGAHRWQSFDQFKADTDYHPNVSLNFVYADAHGDIGWRLAGNVPERTGSGALPLPAPDPANHWKSELRPPDDRLAARNPACGYIATANSRPIPDAEDAGYGVDWLEGYRLARIHELLSQRDDWEPADMWEMHLDTESLPWRKFKPIIEQATPVDEDSRDAKMILLRWDGNVASTSASAALFETFYASLVKKIAERAAPISYTWALGRWGARGFGGSIFGRIRTSQVIWLVTQKPDGWFEFGWNGVIAHSMGDGLRTLRAHRGDSTRAWRWGQAKPLMLQHRLGRGPLTGVFNRGPYTVGGDTNTVHVASVDPLDPLGRNARSIPSARTVIEIDDWDNARFVLLGGQSGNPMSPHYDDQIPVWLQSEGIRVPWTPAAVEEVAESTLTLTPSG